MPLTGDETVDIDDDDAIALDGNGTAHPGPPRTIGLLTSINLVLGQIVGSGVFASPGVVLNLLRGNYPAALLIWLIGGLVTIAGGLVHSGGDHTYIHLAFGSLPSFLYDWTIVLLGRPGGVAVDAVVFGEYLVRMAGYRGDDSDREITDLLKRVSAVGCVLVLTVVNAVSGRWGTVVGDVSTVLKMIALLCIGATAPYFYFHPLIALPAPPPVPSDPRLFALALYSVLFAYDGFNNLNNVAGEVKNPGKTVPRAVAIACALVTTVYVLANVAYLGVVGVDVVRGSVVVVVDYGVRLFGTATGHLFPLIVLIATFGACNATIFTACRTLAKVAHDGNAPKYFAVVDPTTGIPVRALILQAVISSALVLAGSYEGLVNLLAPTGWLSYTTTTLSLIRLRTTHAHLVRPYRAPAVVVGTFLATAVMLVVVGVAGAPREGLASGCVDDVLSVVHTLSGTKGAAGSNVGGHSEHVNLTRGSDDDSGPTGMRWHDTLGWLGRRVWPWSGRGSGSGSARYAMLGVELRDQPDDGAGENVYGHGEANKGASGNGIAHSKAKVSSNDVYGDAVGDEAGSPSVARVHVALSDSMSRFAPGSTNVPVHHALVLLHFKSPVMAVDRSVRILRKPGPKKGWLESGLYSRILRLDALRAHVAASTSTATSTSPIASPTSRAHIGNPTENHTTTAPSQRQAPHQVPFVEPSSSTAKPTFDLVDAALSRLETYFEALAGFILSDSNAYVDAHTHRDWVAGSVVMGPHSIVAAVDDTPRSADEPGAPDAPTYPSLSSSSPSSSGFGAAAASGPTAIHPGPGPRPTCQSDSATTTSTYNSTRAPAPAPTPTPTLSHAPIVLPHVATDHTPHSLSPYGQDSSVSADTEATNHLHTQSPHDDRPQSCAVETAFGDPWRSPCASSPVGDFECEGHASVQLQPHYLLQRPLPVSLDKARQLKASQPHSQSSSHPNSRPESQPQARTLDFSTPGTTPAPASTAAVPTPNLDLDIPSPVSRVPPLPDPFALHLTGFEDLGPGESGFEY
ncbi:hypothetical protein HDU93_006952 [Gonapodya sp. JEL0774]|nr:hypothetical protein HDU93_006952 [Gonapodya sp. JEL0774]